MSRYEKRIEELRRKFGMSNGLELAGQFEASPREKTIEGILNERTAREARDKAAGWQTCRGAAERINKMYPLSLRVRI